MNKKRKPVIIKSILATIVIAFFCICLFVLLVEVEKSRGKDMLELSANTIISILCSIVASIIFAILTRIYSRTDSDNMDKRLETIEGHLARQDELYNSGIKSIRPKSHFDQEDEYWNSILSGSKKRLDLVGHSLSSWFGKRYRDSFIKKVTDIVKSGGTVNVILSTSKPDNIGLMLSNVRTAYNNEMMLSKIEKTLLEYYRLLKDIIPEAYRNNLKVYVIDAEQVTYFYIRTDVQCIISPYTYSPGKRDNIFLLELSPDTAHAKILEEDFDEMIGNIKPVDFRIKEVESIENGITLDKHVSTQNKYRSKDWNRELTEKYVFRDSHGIYEAGLFLHYNDDSFVKAVIELPVGFGCLAKCRYCASSHIDGFYPLKVHQMKFMFEKLYRENNLDKTGMVLLSLTGMGDIRFNQNNVFEFLNSLQGYKNLSLTLSSNFWTPELLEKAVAINRSLPIRYIQYTYVSDKQETRESLIGILSSMDGKDYLDEYISFVKTSDKTFFRINYIVIDGINNSTEDVDRFIELVEAIKDKLIIRLSQLNETNATRENNLIPCDYIRLGEINERMKQAGLQSYVFFAERNDNMNCGQLITESDWI